MTRRNYDYSRAPKILDRLAAGIWPSPAHVILREVRNATGYAQQSRAADALVVSVWPSRGVWFAGVEVKISRGDWRSELKNPEKSTEIQKFCDYWWVAAAPEVVADGEVPSNWGLIEVDGAKARIIKDAPRLTPAPLTSEFIASVLRNMVGTQDALRSNILMELKREMKATQAQTATLDYKDLERQNNSLKTNLEEFEEKHKKLLDQVNAFEWGTGIKVRGDYRNPKVSAVYHLASAIQRGDFTDLVQRLEGTKRTLETVEEKLKVLASAQEIGVTESQKLATEDGEVV